MGAGLACSLDCSDSDGDGLRACDVERQRLGYLVIVVTLRSRRCSYWEKP